MLAGMALVAAVNAIFSAWLVIMLTSGVWTALLGLAVVLSISYAWFRVGVYALFGYQQTISQ